MNSKFGLLSTIVLKKFAPSNSYVYANTARCLWSKPKRFYNTNIIKKAPLQNSKWSVHCNCNARGYHASAFSSSVITRHYSSTPENSTSGNEQPENKPSLYQRFKAMYRDYWYVLLPVHLVTSAGWFGGFYYLASSGVDIVALLEQLNVSDKLINPLRNGHATTGYLAISYALYKIATPLRYTVTLGGTTVSINFLKKRGYIKPMPSKEKLKEIYQDKKEILKGRGQSLKDNMMHSLKPTESKKKNP
ncbi:uncharacterized protein C18orf19 homolog A-like isoform X1 [Macrosteles quadrilineatus]|uniref:uncharacterized protein C18orf19 homolog A-like isoform X1 n=1 Tax=Macrosteles quadrilineatus TaxID=74068 RepID=UPI0023E17C2F|nr:uncharacterized protein C18orf19 homolog A-like isoform X1 [Macrosteles quadrilineatus]